MPVDLDETLRPWARLAFDTTNDDLLATRHAPLSELTVLSPQSAAAASIDAPRLTLTPPSIEGGSAEPELAVLGVLGQGGMGRVFLARQGSLDREVAVKVPRDPGASAARLLEEARIAGALEHPGIVPIYAVASDERGAPALVLKRVDGVSWSQLLRDANDPAWRRVTALGADRLEVHVEVLRQVCNAVAFAHSRGVLHRDIKPANVLIGEFGEVYVADWGIALRLSAPGTSSAFVGTPAYLAPEMATGVQADLDERTDVFLLGATLYECLAGAPPWRAPSLEEALEQAWACRPPSLPVDAPHELRALCESAMRRMPAERCSSVEQFRDGLSAFLRHRGAERLAQAAHERLVELQRLASSSENPRVYELLSECRFGFALALREWPENEPARQGLNLAIETVARFELTHGRVPAARALLAELPKVPADLVAELARADEQVSNARLLAERAAFLKTELDPMVADRQRRVLFMALGVFMLGIVLTPWFVPSFGQWLLTFGDWRISILMAALLPAYAIFLAVGRRTLLSTRLNRQLAAFVGLALVGTLAHRLACTALGVSVRVTVLTNYFVPVMMLAVAGLTFHWSFSAAACSFLAGAVFSLFVEGRESGVFGIAAVGALLLAVRGWRTWRSDFTVERPR